MRNNAGDEIARRLAAAGKEMSIYVHLPFCAGKCPYCSFVSMVPKYGEIEEYCKLLRSEIRFFGDRLAGTRLSAKTLYFGGGTPTLLPPAEWRRLLDCIRENIALAEQIEISVEANPESLTEEHVRLWREETVARISIGTSAQSGASRKNGFLIASGFLSNSAPWPK